MNLMGMDVNRNNDKMDFARVDELDCDLIISGKRFEKGFSCKDKQKIKEFQGEKQKAVNKIN